MIIAVDPGLGGTGWARFDGNQIVDVGCAYLTARKRKPMSFAQACYAYAEMLPSADFCVIERQYVDRRGGFKANGMLKTAFLAGTVAGRYGAGECVYPSQWMPYKNGNPKNNKEWVREHVQEKVGTRKLSRLLEGHAKDRHSHIIDAIGLGLWWSRKENTVDVF